MNTINLKLDCNVNCSDLIAAIQNLTAVLGKVPTQQATEAAAAPAAEAVATVEVMKPAEVAAEPKYTMDQLARAGSDLVVAGKRTEVIQMLKDFGITALTKADESQYNAIAERLIELGAKL